MAAGDVINGIGALVNTTYYYQPAASNESIIMSLFGNIQIRCGLYNGTLDSFSYSDLPDFRNVKMFINNTIYLSYYANAVIPSFSGLQIK